MESESRGDFNYQKGDSSITRITKEPSSSYRPPSAAVAFMDSGSTQGQLDGAERDERVADVIRGCWEEGSPP